MEKFYISLFILFLPFYDLSAQVIVPAEWIDSALEATTDESKLELVEEFEQLIGYDNFPNTKQADDAPYINIISANIDDDPDVEHLMFIGYGVFPYLFTVIKNIDNNWNILYHEQINLFGEEPELMILLGEENRKTVCIKKTLVRSTNVKSDFYFYYKMISGQFQEVLNIVDLAYISGWNHFINQDVTSIIRYDGDDIEIEFDYDFFTVANIQFDDGTTEEQTIFFLDGKETVEYLWDEENKKYKLNRETGAKLDEDKIAVFGNFNDDYAFANAYRQDLENLMQYGSGEQKILIKYFFDNLEKIVKQYTGKPFNTN